MGWLGPLQNLSTWCKFVACLWPPKNCAQVISCLDMPSSLPTLVQTKLLPCMKGFLASLTSFIVESEAHLISIMVIITIVLYLPLHELFIELLPLHIFVNNQHPFLLKFSTVVNFNQHGVISIAFDLTTTRECNYEPTCTHDSQHGHIIWG